MAAPGTIGNLVPRGEDAVQREITDINRRLMELAPSVMASIKPIVDDLRAQQAELEAQNDALEAQQAVLLDLVNNQLSPSPISNVTNGHALATTDADYSASTITVPSGFTQALVSIVVSAAAVNPNPSFDYMYLSAVIDGVKSREVFGAAGASGGSATVATAKTSLLTGLTPGATFDVSARSHAQGAAWAAGAANRILCEGSVIFLR